MIDENSINAHSVEDIAKGFARDATTGDYRCLSCGAIYKTGMVYPVEGGLALAERAVAEHAAQAHGDRFRELLDSARALGSISEALASVLQLVREGRTDKEIAVATGGKSASTIRNQRRALRRMQSDAKLLMALFAAMDGKEAGLERFVAYHSTMPVSDDRTLVTEREAEAIERKYLNADGSLTRIPKKEKEKLVLLRRLAERFQKGRFYTQKEVDAVLALANADYASLRRYLIDYRFLARKPDGSEYWRP